MIVLKIFSEPFFVCEHKSSQSSRSTRRRSTLDRLKVQARVQIRVTSRSCTNWSRSVNSQTNYARDASVTASQENEVVSHWRASVVMFPPLGNHPNRDQLLGISGPKVWFEIHYYHKFNELRCSRTTMAVDDDDRLLLIIRGNVINSLTPHRPWLNIYRNLNAVAIRDMRNMAAESCQSHLMVWRSLLRTWKDMFNRGKCFHRQMDFLRSGVVGTHLSLNQSPTVSLDHLQ